MKIFLWVAVLQAGWALLAPPALAVSANRKVWTFAQPDGTRFKAVLHGDEFYAWHQATDGAIVVQDPKTGVWHHAIPQADGSLQVTPYVVGKSAVQTSVLNKAMVPWLKAVEQTADARAKTMLASFGTKERVPASGTLKGVMLLANFSDTTTTFDPSVFTSLFNDTGYNEYGANGSVMDYYLEASYGKLTIQTDVYGWFKLPHPKAYYGANDANGYDVNPEQMIKDAIAASDTTVNYANYDNDGDGYVDFFGVIHQGQGEEQNGASADCIWSHRSTLDPPVTVDGKKITDYHTEPEMFYSTLTTIGVICHEMGHVFGLPDLYDTDYSSNGLGDWSIMAGGSWAGPGFDGSKPVHFDPWCKVALGWLTPTVVTSPMAGAALQAFDQNAQALLIPVDPYQDGEYFLVANRYARATGDPATGFEQYIPGSGALILHVDDYVGNNDTESRKKVDVEEADGLNQLDNGSSYGDAGDVYTASNTSGFDGASNPNSKDNTGAATGIAIRNFSGADTDTMSCDVTPRGVLSGLSIAYDHDGADSNWGLGYNDGGDDYGCVRFTTATGGTLKRIKTYFNTAGTTNYTVTVYSGWSNGAPTGQLATQSGSHFGAGYDEITLATQPVLAAGADFYVAIRYNAGSLNGNPIPVSSDGVPDLRSWMSTDGKSYTQLTPASGNPFDINIRADVLPPAGGSVLSVTRPGASPTNASAVTFQVNFSQAVLGGTAANFTLAASGLTGAAIAGVTGNGASRTVTVNTGSGSGSIGLTMGNVSGLTDLYGRAITGAPVSSADSYTIDRVVPVLSNISPVKGSTVTSLASVQLTFNKAVTGVSAGSLKVDNVAATTLSGSGAGPYTFSGFTSPALGPVSVALAAGSISDSAGNTFAGDAWTLTRQAVNPQVTLASATVAKGGFINKAAAFTATFDRNVTGFAAGDVAVSNGAVSGFSGAGKSYAFTVTPAAAGAVSVSVPAGVANDAVAPNNPNDASAAYAFTYDNLAPASQVTTPANNSYLNTATFTLRWASSDSGGAGVQSVDIIYQKDNGTTATVSGSPFAAATTSTTFKGAGYGVYQFYSIAHDKAGNVEKSSGFDVRVRAMNQSAAEHEWALYN